MIAPPSAWNPLEKRPKRPLHQQRNFEFHRVCGLNVRAGATSYLQEVPFGEGSLMEQEMITRRQYLADVIEGVLAEEAAASASPLAGPLRSYGANRKRLRSARVPSGLESSVRPGGDPTHASRAFWSNASSNKCTPASTLRRDDDSASRPPCILDKYHSICIATRSTTGNEGVALPLGPTRHGAHLEYFARSCRSPLATLTPS